jgi:tetratricopeptide (TPR) repeat protein
MYKKKKIVLVISGVIVLIMLLKIILDTPYRKSIPALPDLTTLATSLQAQIKTASARAHRNPTAGNLGNLGMVYHSSANYEKAAECYKLAIKKNSARWIWSYYLGYLDKEMGDSQHAIENFEMVLKENPKAYHAWYYIGEGYQDLGKNDKAGEAYKMIASLTDSRRSSNGTYRNDYFPLSTYANYQMARLYLNSDRIEPAEKALDEIILKEKTFGSAYRLRGSIYRIKGDSASSQTAIIRANELPDQTYPIDTLMDLLALHSRSELYILKQIDEAEKTRYADWAMQLANQGLTYLPDNKYLISKTIKLLLRTGSGGQVLSSLKQNFDNFHDEYDEMKQVADLLYEKGYYAESNIYYTRALELKPGNTEIQANLVIGLMNSDKKEQAMVLMDGYVNKDTKNPEVVVNAVYIMLLNKNIEKAKFYLGKLKEIQPQGAKTYLLSGLIAQQEGNIPESRKMFENAFKADPGDLLCIQTFGDVLMRQKLWSRAILHFKNALKYFPNEPYILERIGSLLIVCSDVTLRNYDEGKYYLERVLIHKNSPVETLISSGRSLAQAYADQGDKQKAYVYMRSVMELAISNNVPATLQDDLGKKLKEYEPYKIQ